MRKSISKWLLLITSVMLVGKPCVGQPHDENIQKKFQTGLSLAAEGHYSQAARIYQAILKDNPSLNRVRLELAKTQYLAGQFLISKRQFEKVLVANPPNSVVENIQSFLIAIDKTLENHTYFEAELFFSDFQNYSLKDEYVYLDFFGRPTPFKINKPEEKGNGLRLSSGIGRPYFETNGGAFWVEADTELFRYSNEKFNSTSLELWLPYKTRFKERQFELGPTFETKNKSMSKFQNGFGLKSQYSFETPNYLTKIGAAHQSITYSSTAPTMNALQQNFDITIRPKVPILSRKFRAEFVGINAADKHESNKSFTLSLNTKEIEYGGFEVSPSFEITRLFYDEVKFPFSNKRQDEVVAVNLVLSGNQFDVSGVNVTPKIRFEDSSSTVSIYNYESISISLVLSK